MWLGGSGISIPLIGKGRTFGKVGVGPLSWYGESGDGRSTPPIDERPKPKLLDLTSEEAAAIAAFRNDQRFLERLQRYGMPWRGVQERLREELSPASADGIAYALVPKAMSAVFGQQGGAWCTEKRPSKAGSGLTTWIVVK